MHQLITARIDVDDVELERRTSDRTAVGTRVLISVRHQTQLPERHRRLLIDLVHLIDGVVVEPLADALNGIVREHFTHDLADEMLLAGVAAVEDMNIVEIEPIDARRAH